MFAAEPEMADDCYQSFVGKKHIAQNRFFDTVADGLRWSIGDLAWPIIRDLVDDVITVTDDEIKVISKIENELENAGDLPQCTASFFRHGH